MGEDPLRKGRDVPLRDSLVAGCISGICSRAATAPLDTVKIRLQLQHAHESKYAGVVSAFKTIIREEGLRALWKGNTPAMSLYVAYGAVQFGGYSTFNRALAQNDWPAQVHSCVAGGLAGVCSSMVTYPLDVLRTRFAANRDKKLFSMVQSCRSIWNTEGLSGFFKGVSTSVVSVSLATASMFATYESIKIYCENRRNKQRRGIGILENMASVVAGVVSKTVTFPIDTLRKRLQILNSQHLARFTACEDLYHTYKSERILSLVVQIAKREGISAFYRGYTLGVLKTAPATALSLWVYDYAVKLLGKTHRSVLTCTS
ncbi:LAMI_0E01948g1_1 [Lachancea mirantina]|uniref:LAMI_0E01948g1_1 n=1 Tax=Lachancea mirantina TaxID=1230905 RepID=A0A1G4JJP5_9SACH|nr:LAMI_0E01948g1_1 [Lachancea mirantina]